MWPFKKREKAIPWAEKVKEFPEPPCKNKKIHYYWTELEGWPCPYCASIENQKEEEAKEERMVKKIVEELKRLQNDVRAKN